MTFTRVEKRLGKFGEHKVWRTQEPHVFHQFENFMKWKTLRSVLCLGAHADDIEIGCGATLLELQQSQSEMKIDWVVFSGDATRAAESQECFERWIDAKRRGRLIAYTFEDTLFPVQRREMKEAFQSLARGCSPDLIFTHRSDDAHQDHRMVAELTWNTFRNHTILEYEIAKYEGDLGRPNVFVPVSKENAERKVKLLGEHYQSQHSKPWYRSETFRSLMTLRAVECRSSSGFAEAFYGRKLTISN
jgi:LmbE family N-acetylglucosaminyl deacetylase